LLDEWSVRRLVAAGANVIKVLMYYNSQDTAHINTTKYAFIERIGAECRAYDVPFFLEVLAYDDKVGEEKSFEFARVKPTRVKEYMQEFSKPGYGVDVLKVEIPVNMAYVAGTKANKEGIPVYAKGGSSALRSWLEDKGVQNIQALNKVLKKGAKPWWDFYGGKDAIEVIQRA